MNPLEAALRPVASVLNRNIRETTPARELCDKLDGSVIAVRVRDTALAMYFVVGDGALSLTTDFEAEPDVLISGSLITLARMVGDAGLDSQLVHLAQDTIGMGARLAMYNQAIGAGILGRIAVLADQYQIKPEKMIKQLRDRNGISEIEEQILSTKVLDFLEQNAQVEEVLPPSETGAQTSGG